MSDQMNRRRFLTVLGVTGGGVAALGACGVDAQRTQKLIPYLVQPEDQVPGIATWYATTCRECPAGCGLHAKVREGRVVKLEGNPESPLNHGHLCARGQAGLEGVYNPDRVTGPLARNAQGKLEAISWDDALARLTAKIKAARAKGIAFLTGNESGSFGELVAEWTRAVGGKHVGYEPFAFEALREGNRIAFGTAAVPWYDFAGARYILSFGADFLDTWLSPVGYQHAFSRAHGFNSARADAMAKLVFVGPRMTLTGMNADEWIAPVPGTEGVPREFAGGRGGEGGPGGRGGDGGALPERRRHRGRRECPQLRRWCGREDGQVRAEPERRGRGVVPADERPRRGDGDRQGGAAARARRQSRPFAHRCLLAGVGQGGLQGQLLALPGRNGERRRSRAPRPAPVGAVERQPPARRCLGAAAAGDATGVSRHAPRGRRPASGGGEVGHIQGLSPGELALAACPVRARQELRGLLGGGAPARRRVRRRSRASGAARCAGDADHARSAGGAAPGRRHG